ncbi:MAG TPA: heavy-metal-associated domain-containing protein [Kineosporiaceae bacterium]|nr:heavy-metal-associated domain-containing protein [Kineosporiaceae bacterium]
MSVITGSYLVTGMTCGHCASAVRSEVSALDGVLDVVVELQAGGASEVRVTSSKPLSDELVAAALEEAGDYRLLSSAGAS